MKSKRTPELATKVAVISLILFLGLGAIGIVSAANPHGSGEKGQPNQSCGSTTAPSTPGNAASAPGSAFNPNGQAGSVYAGQGPSADHSNSVNANSQYDVACFQVSQNSNGHNSDCPDCAS